MRRKGPLMSVIAFAGFLTVRVALRQQGFDPLALKGSYAGAMGYGQFMPSSFRAYAVDFDGDGMADIWNNPVDAIGSIANYLSENGWQRPAVRRHRYLL